MTEYVVAWGDYPEWQQSQKQEQATFKAKTLKEAKEKALSHFDFYKEGGYTFPYVILFNTKTEARYTIMPFGGHWVKG